VLKKQKRQRRKSVSSCGAGFFYGDFWGDDVNLDRKCWKNRKDNAGKAYHPAEQDFFMEIFGEMM